MPKFPLGIGSTHSKDVQENLLRGRVRVEVYLQLVLVMGMKLFWSREFSSGTLLSVLLR